jgi:hypothetical protein
MTNFIVTWTRITDGGGRQYNFMDIECGDRLVEIYDALRKKGLLDYEIRDSTIYVVSSSFFGDLLFKDPEVLKKIE